MSLQNLPTGGRHLINPGLPGLSLPPTGSQPPPNNSQFSQNVNSPPVTLKSDLQSWCCNVGLTITGSTAQTNFPIGPDGSDYIRVPGGMVGRNGSIEIDFLLSATNNANLKNPQLLFGNVDPGMISIFSIGFGAQASYNNKLLFTNRNNEKVQVSHNIGLTQPFGVSASAVATFALDTSADILFKFRGTLAVGTDALTLERFMITTIYRD